MKITTLDIIDIINMICGARLNGGISECQRLEKAGLMYFSGNANNPDWAWNRDKLNTLLESELYDIYEVFCNREL